MDASPQCTPRRHAVPVRAFSSLRCLVLVLAALGSGACSRLQSPPSPAVVASEPLSTEACAKERCPMSLPVTSFATQCPTGGCDPRTVNGRGIYTDTGLDYCLKDLQDRVRFCPEGFVHTQEGVDIVARDAQQQDRTFQGRLQATLVSASAPEQPVTLVGIREEQTRLVITYRTADGQLHSVKDDAVSSLRFKFQFNAVTIPDPVWTLHDFEMRVEYTGSPVLPPGARYPVHRYRLFFQLARANTGWIPHCKMNGGAARASFLGGRRVDGLTAAVRLEDTTTVSCETGAIDSCLLWGYTPWNPRADSLNAAEYLFRSCLQAKRAAYFVGRGDSTSYTLPGTLIRKRDAYGISTERIDLLEALWSPNGVECIIPDNRRRKDEVRLANPALLDQVPRCPPANSAQWSPLGKLATGKVPQSP